MSQTTSIDLSQLPAPDAVETLDVELIYAAVLADFRARYPAFSAALESDPVLKLIEAVCYREFVLRARFNDGIRAVLAPLSKGADLENVVARQGIARLVVVPATETTPAVVETDEALLRRYLLSFDRPSAGSEGGFLYAAWTAWPLMGDAAVVGRVVHGRLGDSDVVVTGPGGRAPTVEELATVRAACLAPNVAPEAIGVTVLAAKRREYVVKLVIEVPRGPDKEIVRRDVGARVRSAVNARAKIGGEVPAGLVLGAAYGPNVIEVRDLAPVAIDPDAYTVPVCLTVEVVAEVRP